MGKLAQLKTRCNNLNLPRQEINGSEDGEFYGFRIDSVQRKEKTQEELRTEIEGDEYTISTYGEDTDEWKEANAKLEEKKRELSRQSELSLRFGELGEKLNNFEEDKIWQEIKKQEGEKLLGINYPQFKKMISGRRYLEILGTTRISSRFHDNWRPTLMKRCW